MPALETDLTLKLDPADHSALLAARIAERDAAIVANDHERKRARAEQVKGVGHADTKKAETDKVASLELALAHEDAFVEKVAEVKAKHAAADLTAADEGHDIAQGVYVMKAGPLLSGLAPIEAKRLPMTDKDCDEYIASYRVTARLSFEVPEARRQIMEYEAAHPKIDGEPGGLIPEPQALQDLRAVLAAKLAAGQAEQAKQAAIFAATLAAAGEQAGDYSYVRMGTEGEIVLGHNPLLTKDDKVVLDPKGDGEKIG